MAVTVAWTKTGTTGHLWRESARCVLLPMYFRVLARVVQPEVARFLQESLLAMRSFIKT